MQQNSVGVRESTCRQIGVWGRGFGGIERAVSPQMLGTWPNAICNMLHVQIKDY